MIKIRVEKIAENDPNRYCFAEDNLDLKIRVEVLGHENNNTRIESAQAQWGKTFSRSDPVQTKVLVIPER